MNWEMCLSHTRFEIKTWTWTIQSLPYLIFSFLIYSNRLKSYILWRKNWWCLRTILDHHLHSWKRRIPETFKSCYASKSLACHHTFLHSMHNSSDIFRMDVEGLSHTSLLLIFHMFLWIFRLKHLLMLNFIMYVERKIYYFMSKVHFWLKTLKMYFRLYFFPKIKYQHGSNLFRKTTKSIFCHRVT